jgi:RNA polymerase sigma factor (sigma-70 family)
MEPWVVELESGRPDTAWDLVLTRYRRLIFATIRRYAQDYDDVMDVFTRVCEALREDDLRRLRGWASEPDHRASFSTWLVTVVRNLTVDWFRQRDGRQRISALSAGMPPLRRLIFEHIFVKHRSHIEAYELLRASEAPELTFRDFLTELRATYRAVTDGRRGHLVREFGPPPADEADSGSPELPLVLIERKDVLDAVLNALDPVDRLAVQLYVVDEVAAGDIARIVGLPNAKAVYNRVYRALASIRAKLAEAGVLRDDI